MKTRRIRFIFVALAALSVFYYTALKHAEPGHLVDFSLVWPILGIILLIPAFPESAIARFFRNLLAGTKLRKIMSAALCSLLVAVSAGIFVYILVPPVSETSSEARYVIILGGGLTPKGAVPKSVALRLDTGAAYLERHPGTKAIVSGGLPRNCPRTEASAMAEYLMEKKGIAENVILKEEKARNTIENFAFSKGLIERDANQSVVPAVIIVTSDFHLKRALILAREGGYPDMTALPAPTPPLYLPNAWLREIAAYWKLGIRSSISIRKTSCRF